jgi:hypothetical protein
MIVVSEGEAIRSGWAMTAGPLNKRLDRIEAKLNFILKLVSGIGLPDTAHEELDELLEVME